MRQVRISRRRARRRDTDLMDEQPARRVHSPLVTADPAATLALIDEVLASV